MLGGFFGLGVIGSFPFLRMEVHTDFCFLIFSLFSFLLVQFCYRVADCRLEYIFSWTLIYSFALMGLDVEKSWVGR